MGCYVVAAVDLAHNGEFSAAKKLIDVAIDAGCDAVKLQRRAVDEYYVDGVLDRRCTAFPELASTWREVYHRLEFADDDFAALRAYCEGRIDFLVAPYDLPSLAAAAALGVDGFKVDVACATDLPLLEALAAQPRRVLAAVGGCTSREVAQLVHVLGKLDVALLYTVAGNPTPVEALNLGTLAWLRRFGTPVGFGDTTAGPAMGPVAAALGATVIEKGVTLNRLGRGFGHEVALEPEELRRYVLAIRGVQQALARPPALEVASVEAALLDDERKSIVAAVDVPAGTVLTRAHLAAKAPFRGLSPGLLPYVVGRRTAYALKRDDPVTFGMLE